MIKKRIQAKPSKLQDQLRLSIKFAKLEKRINALEADLLAFRRKELFTVGSRLDLLETFCPATKGIPKGYIPEGMIDKAISDIDRMREQDREFASGEVWPYRPTFNV